MKPEVTWSSLMNQIYKQQAPLPSCLISANGTTIHPVVKLRTEESPWTLPALHFPSISNLPLGLVHFSRMVSKLHVFYPSHIILWQDSRRRTITGRFTLTWSLHSRLSGILKPIIPKSSFSTPHPPASYSFP